MLFQNPEHWQLLWEETYTAGSYPSNPALYIPLSPQNVNIVPSSDTLAVYCESDSAKAYYTLAGWIEQRFFGPAFSNEELIGDRLRIYLNRTKLIRFQSYGNDYKIKLSFPRHLSEVKVIIWEYIGP